jgi:hypothetical protein
LGWAGYLRLASGKVILPSRESLFFLQLVAQNLALFFVSQNDEKKRKQTKYIDQK